MNTPKTIMIFLVSQWNGNLCVVMYCASGRELCNGELHPDNFFYLN